MSPPDRNGRPALARRNTFQRMLDLEKKSKVNRMQVPPSAPLPNSRTSTSSSANDHIVDCHLESHPALLANKGRAMTTPALSVAIPNPDLSADAPTKKYVIQAGNVVPQSEAESGNESARSSICRSPGWDDVSGNKKKKDKQAAKDKKKADKKKADIEVKHTHRMHNRLSKAPPTTNRFSKIVDKSTSTSVATTPEPPQASPAMSKSSGNRSRRGSIDASIKSLLNATQGIPSLWKHKSATPPTAAPTRATPTRESSSQSSSSNGFIGGLKLRLSEEAAVQDRTRHSTVRDQRPPLSGVKPDHRGQFKTTQDTTRTVGAGNPSERVNRQRHNSSSIFDESARTPQQWDSIYAQAGRLVGIESQPMAPVPDVTPIMQRNIKTHKQERVSMWGAVPGETRQHNSPSSGRDSSNASKSRFAQPRTSEDVDNSSGGRSTHIRGGSVDSRKTRDTRGYVQSQRQQSNDRAMAAFEDEYRDRQSTDSARRGRSPSFHSVKSRVSVDVTSNLSKPPALAIGSATSTPGDVGGPLAFFGEYTPPPLEFDSHSPVSEISSERNHNRNGSKGLKGLKIAARSAFSKQSPVPSPSPVANSFVSSNFEVAASPPGSKSSTPEGFSHTGRSSKAERILGVVAPPGQLSSPATTPVSSVPPGRRQNGEASPPNVGQRKGAGTGSHTRTATDSSEEYSTLDEFSNVTTPMASRPHSQKEYFPPVQEPGKSPKGKAVSGSSTPTLSHKKSTFVPGAIPFGGLLRLQDEWARTAMPIEMTDDEKSLKSARTPPGRLSISSSGARPSISSNRSSKVGESSRANEQAKKESKSASALQRQLSLSRSASTPELQDLSFLPALKHQALTKPSPKAPKPALKKDKGKQPASARDSDTRELIKPPPIPLPTTKSEGGSAPNSPTSGAYLRDARMSLPRGANAARSPNGVRFPGSSSSTSLASRNSQPEPMAKMFVICCSCKYFHDMPSKIYECMAKPDNLVEDSDLGVSGVISTSVKCPWCGHGMSTSCCAGYAAVVYLREKLH
ncbi:hypothetical protein BJ875DRAFT_443659 [Amylocarpus encephaloides]|uniref:Uncharacterized protein n=1 Tax=Amylocarpus encephaloides TaxID=45428 RepID=A0A9P7YDU6_9HELO|nr:hypothetical protein BJ875DRAFT_443659 [Amylocarpus encephaloides]